MLGDEFRYTEADMMQAQMKVAERMAKAMRVVQVYRVLDKNVSESLKILEIRTSEDGTVVKVQL